MLHRTLIQIPDDPGEAPVALASLPAQLDHVSAAGLIVTSCDGSAGNEPADGPADAATSAGPGGGIASGAGLVRFRFIPFSGAARDHHADGE